MDGTMSLLQELEESISRGSEESLLRALWHTTDVLITGQYSENQIWVFGQIIERLARDLEVVARAQLARRLAVADNAPVNCINKLAADKSILVAEPVLRQSKRVDVRTLVWVASSGSQQHLLAISKRDSVTEPVTDVLVSAGNKEVVKSVASNAGARFSDLGFLKLIKRSERDSILIEILGQRSDIPRPIFQQLIAKASDEVRKKLERERPDQATEVGALVRDVTSQLHSVFGPASPDYFRAKKAISALHRYGNLHEKDILEYARSHRFPEVTIALSLLCSLPANVIERGLIDSTGEMPVIFAKSLDYSWETTMSLLFLGAPDFRLSAQRLDALKARFSRLTVQTAQGVVKLYQSRKAPDGGKSPAP
jgi:uncharacterized protein (DUF2336 family)